jgi:hypothetical protein
VPTMTACPFCFYKIDSSNLGYLCAGHGNKKCDKVEDEERKTFTGNRTPAFRYLAPTRGVKGVATCDNCDGETKRRACTKCHTALPVDFSGSSNPMLGLVGSKGSGKTVLMTVLMQQLRQNIGRRFGADISIATDNPDGHTSINTYMKAREQALYKEGNLPTPTPAYGSSQREFATPIVLRWRDRKSSTLMAFIDSAGEDFNLNETAQSLTYLKACEYLIVALDPFSLPGARDLINLPKDALQGGEDDENFSVYALDRITELLRQEHTSSKRLSLPFGGGGGSKIPIPVAIVFTKIDAFFPLLDEGSPILRTAPATPNPGYNETDGADVHENMKPLLRQWGADGIVNKLDLNYSNYRLFGVSALGAQPDSKNAHVAAGGVRPHRVDDPVLWLLSQAKTVKAVKTA